MRTAVLTTFPVLLALAACGGGDVSSPPAVPDPQPPVASPQPPAAPPTSPTPPAPQPSPPPPPAPAPAPPAIDAPPAGMPAPIGNAGLHVGAAGGLYLLDPPNAGEPAFDGFVVVAVSGNSVVPPADTTVDLNGVALVRRPGTLQYWQVDPAGPQPAPDANGYITLTASAPSLGLVRHITFPCPADLQVGVQLTSSPSAGESLSAFAAVELAWNGLLWAKPPSPNGLTDPLTIAATLSGYDPGTRTFEGALETSLVGSTAQSVTLPVKPTASPAYQVDLRWPGFFVLDGETGGFCGRAKRIAYAR